MELKEAENIVRSYLNAQKPSAHRFGDPLIDASLQCQPEPDESFEFPGGTVAIEYESGVPMMSVNKYWWLLNKTDYLNNGKKLSLVAIILDAWAAPRDQVAREKAMAEDLEKNFPGFRFFLVDKDEAKPEVVSAALVKAYEAVKA